ncbi:MAG: hypothetical protein U0746_14860 [Gemmataceae bacterium]
MRSKSVGLLAVLGCCLAVAPVRADDAERAPWNFAPLPAEPCPPKCKPPAPPMFGDQFQFGFNFNGGGFQGGFNAGGFQGGFGQFGGQFAGGFQGGFNQGGFNQGGFNAGGFQGGFNQGGFGAPVAVARGAFKIAENESPRPQDRLLASYNYYDHVRGVPIEVHRETIGFEKTILDGNASIGLRLPFFQNHAAGVGTESEVSDLTAIFKYAVVNEPNRVLSTGLALTMPTSDIPTVLILQPNGFDEVHATLIQPFVGYSWSANDFFVHGFSSVMVPTDWRDAPWLFNDVGVGYWLLRGEGWVTGVVPTFEVHVNTPLRHRGAPGFADSVDLTLGSYFYLGERVTLGTAVGTPVTGPKLFAVEGLVNLNWRF